VNYLRKLLSLFALVVILPSGILSAENLIHVVGQRETIYSISRFYSISADELMRANNITDPSRLQTGRRLIIPSSASDTAPSSSGSVSSAQPLAEYRVVRGDTLYSIARTRGITLQNLLEINNFSSNHTLRAGDVIRVPGQGTASVTPNPPSAGNTSAVRPSSGLYALRWPVSPKGITYMTGQMGVVVEGEQNEVVRSLTQGNVISAGPWRKFGRVVIVETAGGYHYMYGGCETLSVNVGDRIAPGAELGRLGVNAVSEKPQLFFMVFRNDNPIDPAVAPRAAGNART
jgi:murein DD-endopeptidase MepM/ murein hydrolase activator NlpD